MRRSVLCCVLLAQFVIATTVLAGFDHGEDIGFQIVEGFDQHRILDKALDDLAAVNAEAAKGLREMLDNGQINIGLGPQTNNGGGWCLPDGEAGVEGDGINLNENFLTGGTVTQADGSENWRHDPDDPGTLQGSNWNQLLGVLAHEWVHANSSLPRPTSADTSAVTDYNWEKPAYEKEMAVLEALGEPTGFYPVPPAQGIGPTNLVKTRHEFLAQKLEKKQKKAKKELGKRLRGLLGFLYDWAGLDRFFSCSIAGPRGEPTMVTWGVDGRSLYGMVPSRDAGYHVELPLDEATDMLGVSGVPYGTPGSVLFVSGRRGENGVVLGISLDGAGARQFVLDVELPPEQADGLTFDYRDGSLVLLGGHPKILQVVADANIDGIPDTLMPEPFATELEWPMLSEAQDVVALVDEPGFGVSRRGFAPVDLVPLEEPLTMLLDTDFDGRADLALPGLHGDSARFAPRILDRPNAGAIHVRVFGVAGAQLLLGASDPDGVFTGEILAVGTVDSAFRVELPLTRPLLEGEYVKLFDPVNDVHEESSPYLVPPEDTNRPPVPVVGGWQVVRQDGSVGNMVVFDARDSFDPDGDILDFEWQLLLDDFDDAPVLGYGPDLQVVLPPGIHVVRLVVTDGDEEVTTYTSAGVAPDVFVDVIATSRSLTSLPGRGEPGVVSVAILGAEEFDVDTLEIETVTVGGAPVDPGSARRLDVDRDGDLDLLLRVDGPVSFPPVPGELILFGHTFDGVTVGGSDRKGGDMLDRRKRP